ncbi:MAG: (2Fe-2S)-binding protein, partial [Sinobacteraceae bacterium]|nr:(2Fe-2S)-binding protein [Nevskiaceae bacterium]
MSSNPIDRSAPEEPKTVRAPGRQDAGGPAAEAKPAAGGTYSQGSKAGGEAGIQPSGRINRENLAKPAAVVFELDGEQVEASPGETIWEVAQRMGTHIPHLCHKPAPGYRPDGNCRACMVEIEGERVLAASCKRVPAVGMKVRTA